MIGKITFLEVEDEDKKNVLSEYPDAVVFSGVLTEDEIIEKCGDTEILCVFIYSKISKKVMDNLPKLKLIITRSVGYDHIDLKAANEKNVPVCNVPDYGAHVIAEHVFALLLAGIRRIRQGDERVESGQFNYQGLRGIALKSKTLGIVGTGKIGRNVARIASLGFLMDVIASDPYPDNDAARENHFTYVGVDELWARSDIISLHCPLLPATEHMVNKETISKMKDGVVIVNTSRGGIIDTHALIDAIKSGKIANAALDVLEHEGNIKENGELLNLPQVIITPHTAFYADDTMKKMYSESFAYIKSFAHGGELPHQVVGI